MYFMYRFYKIYFDRLVVILPLYDMIYKQKQINLIYKLTSFDIK